MSAASSMLKLNREIERVKNIPFFNRVFPYFPKCDSSFFYEGGGWSTFYGKWAIGFRNVRKEGASFVRQPFFLLDS